MKQNLNFAWKYVDNYKLEYLSYFPIDCEMVDIPHNVKDLPYNYFDENDYQELIPYFPEYTYGFRVDAIDRDIHDFYYNFYL